MSSVHPRPLFRRNSKNNLVFMMFETNIACGNFGTNFSSAKLVNINALQKANLVG